jgi:hypothetical protein
MTNSVVPMEKAASAMAMRAIGMKQRPGDGRPRLKTGATQSRRADSGKNLR